MTLSYGELLAIAESLRPRLIGGQLQQVSQPDETRIVLSVRGRVVALDERGRERPVPGPGVTWELLVVAEPRVGRVHLTRETWRNPPSPLAFAQRLRATVRNGVVRDVAVPWRDRVITLDITRREGLYRLVVELSGHHANAFLCEGNEEQRILASLRPTSSRRRDLRPGRTYRPPLPPDDPATFRLDEGRPALTGEALHGALNARYAARERLQTLRDRLRGLHRRVNKHRDRVTRRRDRIAADAARARDAGVWKRRGEALKSQLHRVRRGMSSVRVPDYTDPALPELTIPLDAACSPQENLARLFSRYRKLCRAAEHTRGRLAATEDELSGLVALAERCGAVTLPTDPSMVSQELLGRVQEEIEHIEIAARERAVPAGPLHPRRRSGRKSLHRRRSYRAYRAGDGTPILVGRGGRDNGELTFRVANDADPWLHVRDHGGAHVVVRRTKGTPVSRETLLDAALLAMHFSKARGTTSAEVHVTPRRHVRPLKGAPPGTVRVERSETIVVHADEDRLTRLLATREELR